MEFLTYIVSHYPYLSLAFVVVSLWFILFLVRKNERKVQLVASTFGAVLGPISEWFYFQDYWYPPSILEWQLGPLRLLLEDVLFGMAVFGVAAALVPHRHVSIKFSLTSILQAGLDWLVVGVLILVLFMLGMNSIFAASLAMTLAGVALWACHREHGVAALRTGLSFACVMFAIYGIGAWLFPQQTSYFYSTYWMLHGTEAGSLWFGVAATEIIFAAAFGFYTATWARVRLMRPR